MSGMAVSRDRGSNRSKAGSETQPLGASADETPGVHECEGIGGAGSSLQGRQTGASTCPSLGGATGAAAEHLELEGLLSGYPLVRGGSKSRIREVYAALRSQHEEKLDEWQQEAQGAAGAMSQHQRKAGGWCRL